MVATGAPQAPMAEPDRLQPALLRGCSHGNPRQAARNVELSFKYRGPLNPKRSATQAVWWYSYTQPSVLQGLQGRRAALSLTSFAES